FYSIYSYSAGDHPYLHSFPTRRSSDLEHLRGHAERRTALLHCHVRDEVRDEEALLRGDERGGGIVDEVAMLDRSDAVLNRAWQRSEEHTSELQSLAYLVCRLLLEKKKK